MTTYAKLKEARIDSRGIVAPGLGWDGMGYKAIFCKYLEYLQKPTP
jgi:hypothetical protein